MNKSGAGFSAGTDAVANNGFLEWLDSTADNVTSHNDVINNPEDERYDELITGEMVDSSPSVSNANVYMNLEGENTIDKLKWLIEHDPENARAWTEALLGYEANLQNTNDARAYEMYMSNTRVQRTAKDLEAAGINPLLAYQYLSGTSGSVGTAGYPDTNVASVAEDRAASRRTNNTNAAKVGISLISAFIAMMALFA